MWILCLALGLLASALPAWAAEIVEVRIGRHPEFTRVVFELDRAAGYRIERSDPSMDVAELVVSLEATSIPRSIDSSKSLIEQVEIQPMGSRSIARVRLARDGLRLKEMILTNPPRIVLDVLYDVSPAPRVARASTPPVAPTPVEPGPSASDEEAFDEVVAQIPVEKAARIATSKRVETPSGAEVVEEVEEVELGLLIESGPAEEPAAVMQGMIEEEDADVLFDDDPQMVADERSTSTPISTPTAKPNDTNDALAAALEVARKAPASSKPKSAAAKPAPRPMVARTTPSKEDGGGWLTWALVGAGAVVLLVGGALVARRRGASDDDDQDWDDDEAAPDSYADEDTAVVAVDDNPFSGLTDDGEQTMLGASGDASGNVAAPAGMMNDGDATRLSLPDEEKESESVVFDDTE